MVPCTPSALIPCTFHSLQNGTMHTHTIRSGTLQLSLPSQWYHAHAHHPLWYHATFTPSKMVPCTRTPSALVPFTFHFFQNGTMHTILSDTMHLSHPSQWYHEHAHHPLWYHVPFTVQAFTMYHSRVRWYQVPKIARWYHVAFTVHAGTKYHSHARCHHEPFTVHVSTTYHSHARCHHEPFPVHVSTTYHSHHFLWYSVNFTSNWNTFFYMDGKIFHFSSSIWVRGLHFLVIRRRLIMPLGSQTSILEWRGWQRR